jgi:NDP-sugar pyrophosphorylase family protein
MTRSIIHAGGESTRLREIFDGPKALAPIGKHTLLWFHLQPLLKSGLIREYTFTLRHRAEVVKDYLDKLKNQVHIRISSIVEPKPLGRAGSVRLAIEQGIVRTDEPYLMSNPDDLVPINVSRLIKYADEAERKGKSAVMVMAKKAANPFGIGLVKKKGNLIELQGFQEKPELEFVANHFANTGMILFLPEAMKEFQSVPLDRPTHPENKIIPKLVEQNKVAVFLVERWLSINFPADFKRAVSMGPEGLFKFLDGKL